MSAQRTTFRSWEDEKAHRQRVIAKAEKVQGLESLLAEWEPREFDSEENHEYVLHLKERVRQARNQYECMKP